METQFIIKKTIAMFSKHYVETLHSETNENCLHKYLTWSHGHYEYYN